MNNDPIERIARQFHETYERLAPQFGYETRKASAVAWENVPENNRKLMIATVAEVHSAMQGKVGGLLEAIKLAMQALSAFGDTEEGVTTAYNILKDAAQ